MSKHPEQIREAAKGLIDEEIVAAAFAKPRGATTASVAGGMIAREIGNRWSGRQNEGAAAVGIELGNPGAIVLTPTSLITMKVGVSMTGSIKEIKELLTSVPLENIDTLEVKRMGAAGVMEIAAGGASFKLEGKVDDMRAVEEAFKARAAGSA